MGEHVGHVQSPDNEGKGIAVIALLSKGVQLHTRSTEQIFAIPDEGAIDSDLSLKLPVC